jgi:hypothetical protein
LYGVKLKLLIKIRFLNSQYHARAQIVRVFLGNHAGFLCLHILKLCSIFKKQQTHLL